MCLMKVMRQGSELHGLASYINKYNWLCVFWGGVGKENPARWPGEILKNRFNKMVFTVQTYAIIVNLSSLH